MADAPIVVHPIEDTALDTKLSPEQATVLRAGGPPPARGDAEITERRKSTLDARAIASSLLHIRCGA